MIDVHEVTRCCACDARIELFARCIYCGRAVCRTCGVYTLDGRHCWPCYEKEVLLRDTEGRAIDERQARERAAFNALLGDIEVEL